MRLLVCGSREWGTEDESWRLHEELWALRPAVLIHGAARGADECADGWAHIEGAGAEVLAFRADWNKDGKAAGPIRNERMLRDGKPDRGLAFGALWRADPRRTSGKNPGWRLTGTGDMVEKLLRARLPVRWVEAHDAPAVDLVKLPGPPAKE